MKKFTAVLFVTVLFFSAFVLPALSYDVDYDDLSDELQELYDAAFEEGYEAGYDIGYDEGYGDADNINYDAYESGYDAGYWDAYDELEEDEKEDSDSIFKKIGDWILTIILFGSWGCILIFLLWFFVISPIVDKIKEKLRR